MKSRWIQLGGIGLLVFLVAFLINFPTAWALNLIEGRVPAKIAWREASGSVLDGTVRGLAVVLGGNRRIRFESMEVQTALLPLLLGRIEMEFHAKGYDGEVTGSATFGRQSWRVARLDGTASLEAFAGLLPELGIMGMTGGVRFAGDEVSGNYRDLPATGRIGAFIDGLRVALIDARQPLGSYTLEINAGQGEGLRGGISTSSKDALLIIEGEGMVDSVSETFRFEGYAMAADNAPDPVRSLLPLLGPVENGRASINWPPRR